MKQNLLALLFLLTLNGALFAQKTIYVKSDAIGANDGTSWANAYSSLDVALSAAVKGDQIWVAAATYKPATSFLMSGGVALYGGFKGTESTLTARDIAANVTILSGDLAGNDVAGNFTMNRSDNAIHVLEIAPGPDPADRAVVDGFTFKGGQSLVGTTNPDLSRRGGGILTTGPTTVRNCRFTDNYADAGGSLAAVNASAAGTLVDNCLFEKNGTASLSSGIYFRDMIDGAVNNCIFRDNETNRGCLYMITSVDIVVDSCLFQNNSAGMNPCAGMYTWQTTFKLTNSVFNNNSGVDYGAMYNDGRNGVYPFTIDKCLFEANKAVDTMSGATAACGAIFNATSTGIIKNTVFKDNQAEFGGAIYNSGSVPGNKIVIDSCRFEGNFSTVSRGGALYNFKSNYELKNSIFDGNASDASTGSAIHNADSTLFYVHDCDFTNGTARFGGAISNYSAGDIGTYERCNFVGNKAVTSGGAMTNGFTANVTIKDCKFETNTALFGGALFAQNTNTSLTIKNSLITSNMAENNGGGIATSQGIRLTIEDSQIELNQAATGGGITLGADDTVKVKQTVIRNTILLSNFATTQGAGINVSNNAVQLESCLFAGNQNFGAGAGGALINNAANTSSSVKAVNCTFADNSSPIGAGIAQWEDTTAASVATLELQNCVLFNPLGNNYEIEAGLPEVTSKGGNLCGDISLTGILIGLNDLLGAGLDPLFANVANLDYHLTAGSPCIDKGVAAGAPATDLEGKPRSSGGPDQGCYEFGTTGTNQPGVRALPLRLMPNPTEDRAVLVIESDWSGDANVQVFSQNGALVQTLTTPKFAGRWVQVLQVQDLPAGIYQVRTQLGAQVYEGSLVKK